MKQPKPYKQPMGKIQTTIRDCVRKNLENKATDNFVYEDIKPFMTDYIKAYGADDWFVDYMKRHVHVWQSEKRRLEAGRNPQVRSPWEFG